MKNYQDILDTQAPTESDIACCKEYVQTYENRIEDYDDVIKRLNKAYNELQDVKQTFEGAKKSDKKLAYKKLDWTGNSYNTFKTKMTDLDSENENYYKNSIDAIQDAINNKIAKIKKDRSNSNDIIDKLLDWLETVGCSIENYFN